MRNRMRMGAAGRRRMSVAVGAVVLAFGAIVLARGHSASAFEGAPATNGSGSGVGASGSSATRLAIETPELSGFLALTQGAILQGDERELFAELRVTARTTDGAEAERRPVALAVALDTSGSMQGEKIVQAVAAVRQLLARMQPEDRISIVSYDGDAHVLIPLTPVASAREVLESRLAGVHAGGGTNIPAGLATASSALAQAPASMVRRLVLISDGRDGSGVALAQVSTSVGNRAQDGATTSALGVGIDYDERWLTQVADAGRGNYEFLARGRELSAFLTRELDQASSTVADGTELALELPPGWRLERAYGASVGADGRSLGLGALFAGQRRRATLLLVAPPGWAGRQHELAATLRYRARTAQIDRNLALGRLSVSTVADEESVIASRDLTLHAAAFAQHADAQQALAIAAWRQGDGERARQITVDNNRELERWRAEAPAASQEIDARIEANEADLGNFHNDAASSAGRAWGLQSNSARRARSNAF